MTIARRWLEDGDEVCEHCLQLYVYEAEYRCEACDGPVCPDCVLVVRASRLVLCPRCQAEGDG